MKTEVKLPEIADNVVSGFLSRILVKVGDVIEKDQSIIEIETDKAATDIPSPVGGKIIDIKVNKGDEVRVGQTILVVEAAVSGDAVTSDTVTGDRKPHPTPDTRHPAPDTRSPAPDTRHPAPDTHQPSSVLVPASPTVRRFARELGVDITKVKGSGPGGRISDADVKAHVKQLVKGSLPSSPAEYAEVPDFSQWGPVELEPMSRIRQITAESTVRSWQTIPQVVQFDKADITEVEKFRLMNRAAVEKAGGKLTMTAILLKVTAMALRQFPKFNASVDMKNRQVVYKDYVHIGIAVDTEQGLLVPIVRDVDKKSITALSIEMNELAERARNRKLTSEEMQGGNFTISNLGGIGGTAFTPIVYPHQVAILGVSRSAMEQVYRDGEFVARNMLPLSLSYDHRLIDGADGARFLGWISKALEQPLLMSL
ncbi:MAG: 2-oxo acid dehydrogenase subunit E2 [Bacteroidales bacterium]